ncbi:MAG: hypothetical protein LBK99_02925 [Opitutaceae bacterium]|jgi:hypothetical protein|nr:hypothetical protein [Opitutaceae bacterium]
MSRRALVFFLVLSVSANAALLGTLWHRARAQRRASPAATDRFELPSDTPDRIHALRDTVSAATLRIADDPALSHDGKKAALARLADDTRVQVREALGNAIADAWFANNGMDWLKEVAEGQTVEFDKEHGFPRTRPLSRSSRSVPGVIESDGEMRKR